MTTTVTWKAPGPVAAAFFAARAPVAAIMGPIGSGKTTAALMKHLTFAQLQKPDQDGVRRYKLAVVRDTYREMWRSTIPSWWKRVPQSIGEWVGAKDGPAAHTLRTRLPDGSRLEFIAEWGAIGEHAAEDFARGYEPTAVHLEEADRMNEGVFVHMKGRVGRYPDKALGGPTWFGVTLTFNAPEFDSWLFARIADEWRDGIELFRQPPGLIRDTTGRLVPNPHAENLANLPVNTVIDPDGDPLGPGNYYLGAAANADGPYVDRMILCKPGFSRQGLPVWPEFVDGTHVARDDLVPINDLPLIVGMDAGLTPAAVIGQRTTTGQWRIVDELVPPEGTGPHRFADALTALLAARYKRWHDRLARGWDNGDAAIAAWADPASGAGGIDRTGDASWIEIVSRATGLVLRRAPTNALAPRLDAVRRRLEQSLPGGAPGVLVPAFVLSPRCRFLRKAMAAGYIYGVSQAVVGGNIVNTQTPIKNQYSHVADALQYAMLGGGEYEAVMGFGEARARKDRRGRVEPAAGWMG